MAIPHRLGNSTFFCIHQLSNDHLCYLRVRRNTELGC